LLTIIYEDNQWTADIDRCVSITAYVGHIVL